MAKTYVEVRRRGDRFYAYEREPYWDSKRKQGRKRTIRFLGPCDRRGRVLRSPKVHLDGVSSSVSVGRPLVFLAAAEKLRVRELARAVLGGDDEVAGRFVLMAVNQASDRVPDEHLPAWAEAGPLPRLLSLGPKRLTPEDFGNVHRALCHLSEETHILEDRGLLLQERLTRAWRSQSREPPGAYYDVTKQAYYGWTNPYAQVGHDSNGGLSPVVGFGMVVSEGHHHPYLCRALPGAQNDSLGVAGTIEMLRARAYERIRLVMDRGMISKENVDLSRREGYPLIGLVKGWDSKTVALASLFDEEELERPEYLAVTSRGSVYARALTTTLFGIPEVRVAVVENLKRRALDREGRDQALQELKGPVTTVRLAELKRELRVQNPKLRKQKGYVPGLLVPSRGRRGFRVDPQAVARDRPLDGRFLIFSTDLSLSGPEMYRAYFARDGIEKVFRTGKGELCLGPVRYHSRERLDAYATIFYTASLLWSWSEQTLQRKYPDRSLAEALGHLENVAWVRFGTGKSARERASRLTEEQKRILSALGAESYLHSP